MKSTAHPNTSDISLGETTRRTTDPVRPMKKNQNYDKYNIAEFSEQLFLVLL